MPSIRDIGGAPGLNAPLAKSTTNHHDDLLHEKDSDDDETFLPTVADDNATLPFSTEAAKFAEQQPSAENAASLMETVEEKSVHTKNSKNVAAAVQSRPPSSSSTTIAAMAWQPHTKSTTATATGNSKRNSTAAPLISLSPAADEPQPSPPQGSSRRSSLQNRNKRMSAHDDEIIQIIEEPPSSQTAAAKRSSLSVPHDNDGRVGSISSTAGTRRSFRRVVNILRFINSMKIFANRKLDAALDGAETSNDKKEDAFLQKYAMDNAQLKTLTENDDKTHGHHHHHKFSTVKWLGGMRLRASWVIDPSEPTYYRWLFFVSIAVIYNLVIIMPRAIFREMQDYYLTTWLVLDYSADFIYVLDICVHLFTGYLEHGLLVREAGKLRRHYVEQNTFWLDILSILPTDIAYLIANSMQAPWCIFRLNRLLRAPRMREFFYRTEARTSFPNVFRISEMVFYIVVIIHWNACIYFFVSDVIGLGSDGFVYPGRYDEQEGNFTAEGLPLIRNYSQDPLLYKYVFTFYWSTLTLTTVGETPPPARTIEFVLLNINYLVGVLIFATIVGSVGSMISNMNAARVDFQNKMDGVKQYMAFRKVGRDLEQRVIKWFDYIWSNKQMLNEEAVLATLPDKLKAEIGMHVHLATLKQVRIFQDTEPGLLMELVLKLRLQVFSPGDYICRKGDIGKEMYIVKRGRLSVVADDGTTVFATLGEGSVFGELSILNIAGNKTGNRRSANVRSIGYSDLFVLSKDDLWTALSEYPEAKKLLIERGRQILMKDNLLDEEALKESERQEANIKERIDIVENDIETIGTQLASLLAEYATVQQKLKQRLTKLEQRAASRRAKHQHHQHKQQQENERHQISIATAAAKVAAQQQIIIG